MSEEYLFEQVFEAIIEAIPDPVVFTDLEGKILAVSQRTVDMLGYESKEKMVGESVEKIFAGEERIEKLSQDAMEHNLIHVERTLRRKNNTTFPAEISVVPVRSRSGKMMGFMATGMDISDRKHLLKKLEDTHNELDTLMNSTRAVLYVASLDDNYPVVYITRNVEDIFGYTPEQFIEHPEFWYEKTHPDDRHKIDEAIDDLFVSKPRHRVDDYRFLHADGQYVWVRDEMMLKTNEDGEEEIVGFMADITPRKEKEIGLRGTGERMEEIAIRLRTIMESSRAAIYVSGARGNFPAFYITSNVKDITGYEPDEFISDPNFWYERIHPDDKDIPNVAIEKLFSDGHNSYEYRFLCKDKVYRWMLDEMSLVTNEKNEPVEIVGFMTDITERKEAEIDTLEMENLFQKLSEIASDGVGIHKDGVVVEITESLADLHGYHPSELIGTNAFDLLSPKSRELSRKRFDERFEGTYEAEMLKKDGSTFDAEVTVFSAIYHREPVRVLAVKDITERKEEESVLRSIAGVLPDGIVIHENGKIVYASSSVETLWGYKPEEMEGKSIFEFTPEKERVEEMMPKSYNPLHELRGIRKDGSEFYAEAVTTEVKYKGKKSKLAVFKDISRRKKYEKDLQKANEELGNYAHVVSHDLKGSLATMNLCTNLLKETTECFSDKEFYPEINDLLESLSQQVFKADRLVDDLLSLAETGQQPQDISNVDITHLIQEIFRYKADEMVIEGWKAEYDQDLGTIRGDATQMYQLFVNLINNTLRHSNGDVIEVRRVAEGHYLVRDNGTGIPESLIGRIFDPFVKTGESTTGLGLSTVKKMVDVYGGEIKAYNDRGAVFDFTLHNLT